MKAIILHRIQSLTVVVFALLLTAGCATSSRISQEQLEGVRQAAQKVLPDGAQVGIFTERHVFSKPDVVILAHLLVPESADEGHGYVKPYVVTHDELERLVRLRCANILRSLVRESKVPNVSSFIIQARDGGRVMPALTDGFVSDGATTFYVVEMSARQMRDPKWLQLSDEQLMERWRVTQDIVPPFQFRGTGRMAL